MVRIEHDSNDCRLGSVTIILKPTLPKVSYNQGKGNESHVIWKSKGSHGKVKET